MTDVATLGISIDSKAVKDAAREMQDMARSAKSAEGFITAMAQKAGVSYEDMAAKVRSAAKEIKQKEKDSRDAAKVMDTLAGETDKANRSISAFTTGFARAFIGGAVAAGMYAAINFVKGLKDELIEIDRISRITGASLQQIAGLQSLGRMNGLTNEQVNQGARGLAEALRDAGREENDLSRLFAANNIALRDRNGQVVNFNTALERASTLIANAGTELDKIDIARKLGLSEEWVRVLQRGPMALRQAREEAELTGPKIDAELVQRAREFDQAWNNAMVGFGTVAKATVSEIGRGLAGLIEQANTWVNGLSARFSSLFPRVVEMDAATRQAFEGRGGQVVNVGGGGRSARPAGMSDATWEAFRRGLQDRGDMLRRGEYAATFQRGRLETTVIPTGGRGGRAGGNNDETDALENEIQRLRERTEAIQTATNVIGLDTFAREKALATQRLMSIATREEIELTAERRREIEESATAYARAQAAAEQAREAQQQYMSLLSTGRQAFSGFFQEFSNGIAQGKSVWEAFASAALNALKRIADRVMEMAANGIFNMLFGTAQGGGGLFGGLGGGLFGGLFQGGGGGVGVLSGLGGFANGGAFQGGNVVPFAYGGIVTRPTLFPMANGAGLMGEAGPEAIMPLRRDASGRLGVYAAGGAGAVNLGGVVVNYQGNSDNPRGDGQAMGEAILATLERELPGIITRARRDGRLEAA